MRHIGGRYGIPGRSWDGPRNVVEGPGNFGGLPCYLHGEAWRGGWVRCLPDLAAGGLDLPFGMDGGVARGVFRRGTRNWWGGGDD